ncbi:GNAT family N-acetyltransferase [Mesoplasma florum]|uniref:GNAT family N-acetyltransferase n=1 Tax=Mesoplasma florum TaxID=2151 RepID=UPI000D026F85|nr:GNAT family N-acetyltransferase [Mesoplasma florum]AVN59083.1 GNAT family N-acetyltransferase [Mesoplasma florum]AVN65200.1 GNAT family N-acetyltransferase [Mesoplasma florum]
MKIKLIKPDIKYLNQLEDFIKSFAETNGIEEGIPGSSEIVNFEQLSEWVDFVNLGIGRKFWIPFKQYLAVDENDNFVGIINIRLKLNEYLLNYGGHIGYSVSPKNRNKGIATEMLSQALEVCKKEGIYEVLITCTNEASEKVIIKNGGLFEDIRSDGKTSFKRFWIKQKKS